MKKSLLFITIALFAISTGCMNTIKERGLSNDQIKLKQLTDRYSASYDNAPNQMSKDRLRSAHPVKVSAFIRDTLKGILTNCKVKMTELKVMPINNVVAFYATFRDSLNNQYWMEFDYDDNQRSYIDTNSAYVLLKSMPENQDTVLSFFYMGETEWVDASSTYNNDLKFRVVPFPKDYNFDSARSVNKGKLKTY
ncbi:MAG TPA: hypothetical protein VIM07_15100 [Chitinophagaceae bacterium]